jgi:peptidyl-prolyl cis-trans isomerase SurA
MKRRFISLLLLSLLPAPAAVGQVIDRMVAVVDGEVVTQSDIEDYRALARGFGEQVSDDDGVVLNQIIEDMLISRQISQFPGNEIQDRDLEAYIAGVPGPVDLPPARLRALARRRLELERYYASLSQSLRATDEEIRELYDNEFVPRLREEGAVVIPPLDQVRSQLEEIIVADKLVEEIELRVELLHRRYRVDIVE